MNTTTSTGFGQVAYRTSGEGRATLVFMHGWAGSGAYFESVIEHLDPDSVYSVTLDLPGHGRSAQAPTPCTLDQISDVVIAVADAAGADTFVLLGFSMSAKFAQYVTYRHPDRVLGQILVAGCPAGALALPTALVDDWCARAGNPERLADVVLSCATQPIPSPVLDTIGRDAARVSAAVLRETIDLVADSSFAAEIAGSDIGTLVVGGSGDWLFPPDVLREAVVGPLARAHLEVLDCGHEVPIEAPRELAGLVSDFVRECSGPAQAAGAGRVHRGR